MTLASSRSIATALCWVHAERLVHKLDTFTDWQHAAQQFRWAISLLQLAPTRDRDDSGPAPAEGSSVTQLAGMVTRQLVAGRHYGSLPRDGWTQIVCHTRAGRSAVSAAAPGQRCELGGEQLARPHCIHGRDGSDRISLARTGLDTAATSAARQPDVDHEGRAR